MQLLAEHKGINYRKPDLPDFEEMASLLATSFSRNEPMAVAAGQTCEEIAAMLYLFQPQVLKDNLSVISQDTDSGKIAGALLVKDFLSPLPSGLAEASPNFAPIGHLLDQLEEKYRNIRKVKPGQVLHLFMIGVDPEYVRQGIGITLTELTMQQGIMAGYQYAVAEATNHKSSGILQNLGFVECARISYAEYLYAGQYVFRSILTDKRVVMMEKEL